MLLCDGGRKSRTTKKWQSSRLRANHKGRKYNISDFHYFPTKQPRGAELGLFNTPQIVKESSCHHVSLG